jgi:hypothetical protein
MPTETEETIDIENSGNDVSLRLQGKSIVSLAIRGDGTATYQVDARTRAGSWIQSVSSEYSGSADYDDVLETGVTEMRIRCSTGTGTGGDQATITLMASGG